MESIKRTFPDLALAFMALGYMCVLIFTGAGTESSWNLVAWGQFPFYAILALLVFRTMTSNSEDQTARAWLLGATAFGVLAISLLAHMNDPYFWDGAATSARASLIREGTNLFASRQRFSLFYYVVALLQAVSNQSVAVVRLGVGIFVFSGLAGVGILTSRHSSRGAALVASILAISLPAYFSMSHWLYIDMFLLTICVWMLVVCDKHIRQPSRISLVTLLALVLAAMLTKEYAVLVIPLCFGLRWVHGLPLMSGWQSHFFSARSAAWRRWFMLGLTVLIIALGYAFWSFYLRFWRGLFPVDGPHWGLHPLIIVPGNPYLTPADQIRISLDLIHQSFVQLAGSGLFGFALFSLISVGEKRRFAGWFVLLVSYALVIWPHLHLEPAPLNQLWRFGPGLNWIVVLAPLVLVLLRLLGWVRFKITRWQWLMLGGWALSTVFFAMVTKAGMVNGLVMGSLDWRYPLFSYLFLIILSSEFIMRLLDLGRRNGRLGLGLACLAPVLLVGANLVAGTNYIRQSSSYVRDQHLAVIETIDRAQTNGVGVVSTWPYFVVRERFNYGPYRWRDEGIALNFLWKHDFSQPSDLIGIFDTIVGSQFISYTEREGTLRFNRTVPSFYPLRPSVKILASPSVYVVDLGAPLLKPDFAPLNEEFAKNKNGDDRRWSGLGNPELWGEMTMRWTVGPEARVVLGSGGEEQYRLQLRAMAFGGVSKQTVTVLINDQELEALPIGKKWQVLEWVVPGNFLKRGMTNALVIRPRETMRPVDLPGTKSTDKRELGLGVDWLRIEGINPGPVD